MKKHFLMLATALCLHVISSAQGSKEILPYAGFLKNQRQSAKEYVLQLFKTHDIVIICERTHTEMTQYNLFTDIISDKRFIENVGNVFVEIGVSKLNPALNDFLHTRNITAGEIDRQVKNFQRNASMWPLWSSKNYSVFYKSIYKLNNSLQDEQQVNFYPSDIPFFWPEADSAGMPALKEMLPKRDSIMAVQVIAGFDAIQKSGEKRKKALVIMNYRHAFNQEFLLPGNRKLHNVGYYLFQQYGNRVANVFLNTISYGKNDSILLVQQGKWDAAFKKAGKESLGFDFVNSPFGKDSLDVWPYQNPFTYKDVFTGFIFYLPVEKHVLTEGVKGLADSTFKNELLRRIDLITMAGGEFKAKMNEFRKVAETKYEYLNVEENKKYYLIDSLLGMRNRWMK